jgi:hypothetical protein
MLISLAFRSIDAQDLTDIGTAAAASVSSWPALNNFLVIAGRHAQSTLRAALKRSSSELSSPISMSRKKIL